MKDCGTGDEELAVEQQLELHLEEQKDSLSTVKEALASDPSNTELLSVEKLCCLTFEETLKSTMTSFLKVYKELQLAIKDVEDGLLHLKRSRLLKEADSIFVSHELGSLVEDVKMEPLDPKHGLPVPIESVMYSVGSKCRFRHTDGQWYNGHILALEGDNAANVSFLTPTSENKLMCKFFLQQRCRFGSHCRMSHGFSVSLSSLKPYIPTEWRQSFVGSSIWAVSGGHSNIWRRAELESWDDKLSLGQVIFQDDGSSAKLGSEFLSTSAYANVSDEENDDDEEGESLSTETSSLKDEEDVENGSVHEGIGFLDASVTQNGIQTETAIFANWEQHTRGIASKMMANMGYRRGMGLGAVGQGMVDPISVRVLPSRQSLDHALALNNNEENTVGRRKKRGRGGKRKQEKKIAEVARNAEVGEEEESNVFSFINNQLTLPNTADVKGKRGTGDSEAKAEDRRSLVAYEDEMKELRMQVEKLEEMVNRNRKDKAVFEAASRKLRETCKALADAEAAHAAASNVVLSKEKEKRWLKF